MVNRSPQDESLAVMTNAAGEVVPFDSAAVVPSVAAAGK